MVDRVKFIRDHYSERHSKIMADFVMCRHTLEHISKTERFMRQIRRGIGDKQDTVVFFEVPDTGRVLRELAFWDIYYEHCSYFTAGSLATLFHRSGFEVLELTADFDEQYLLIEARPASVASTAYDASETELLTTSKEVAFFSGQIDQKLADWRAYLKKRHQKGDRIVIWGSGSKCVAFLTTLRIREEIGCVVDINPYRHDKFIPGLGLEVRSPEFLKNYQPDVVIVMNPIYKSEITKTLHQMELRP